MLRWTGWSGDDKSGPSQREPPSGVCKGPLLRTLSEKHLGASIKEDLFAFNVMQHVFVQIPNISLVFRLMSALPV